MTFRKSADKDISSKYFFLTSTKSAHSITVLIIHVMSVKRGRTDLSFPSSPCSVFCHASRVLHCKPLVVPNRPASHRVSTPPPFCVCVCVCVCKFSNCEVKSFTHYYHRKMWWWWWWLCPRVRGFWENVRPFIPHLRFFVFFKIFKWSLACTH